MADIHGTTSNDTLYGTTGDDVIYGYEGIDVIHASTGTDQVDGGIGNDRLIVTISNASLFAAPIGSRTYVLTSTSITDSSGSLNTSFSNIERVVIDLRGTAFGDTVDASGFVSTQVGGFYPLQIIAGDGDDTIIGSAGADYINAGLGDNIVDAGGGEDEVGVLVQNSSGAVVYVTASGGVLHTTQNGLLTNSISNAETFFVRASDTSSGLNIDASGLVGFTGTLALGDSNATDILIGSAGRDIFVNYGGNTLGNDLYTGNGGADTYDYVFAVDAMNGDTITDFDWDDIIDLQYNSVDYGAPLIANQFIGTAQFSGIVGEYRYEVVGNKTLVQVDTNGDAVADQTLTISNGAFVLAETSYRSNILQIAGQRVTGTAAAESLTGTTGMDLIDGLGGADSMSGLGGDDIYYVDDRQDKVIEAAGEGTDRVHSTVSFSLGANVEMLTLAGLLAINGTGNALDNTLIGNGAANILNGGTGADTMEGRLGNDTYRVDNAGDIVVEGASEGTDRVLTAVSYTLTDNVENLTLVGSAGIAGTGNALNNVIVGNAGANTLTGGDGNDTLNGLGGTDTLFGGTGDDNYVVDNVGDVVTELAGEGNDLVRSNISYTLGDNLERLILIGNGATSGTGNAVTNGITGNNAANTLRGEGGNDVILGSGGGDNIYGGVGNDRLTGGVGYDNFYFDTALNATSNVDKIVDFASWSDSIYLDSAIFSGISAMGTLSASAFRLGTAAADADDRIIYDKATGKVYYDADGNGAGAAVLFAQLSAGANLTNADFIIF